MSRHTDQPIAGSKEDAALRRRGRSWAIMIALVALCVLFYAITIAKLAHP